MKLWLITKTDDVDWDDFDSAVVAANTKIEAKNIHPEGHNNPFDENKPNDWASGWTTPDKVKAEYLGNAKKGTKKGVICSRLNAYLL